MLAGRSPWPGSALALLLTLAWPFNPQRASAADTPQIPKQAELSGLDQARSMVRAGDHPGADAALAAYLTEHPDDPVALLLRGEVLLLLARPAEARPLLEHCVEIEPARPRVHFQLAAALSALGEQERAIEHYGKEIELTQDPAIKGMARLNRSMIYQKEARWLDAAAELEALIQLDAQRREAYGDLAGLYLHADELDNAARTLDRGLEAGFSSAGHFCALGARYYRQGALDKAIAAYTKALTIEPGRAEAELGNGVALEQLGRKDEAAQHFRRYLELRPDAPEAKELRKRLSPAGSR